MDPLKFIGGPVWSLVVFVFESFTNHWSSLHRLWNGVQVRTIEWTHSLESCLVWRWAVVFVFKRANQAKFHKPSSFLLSTNNMSPRDMLNQKRCLSTCVYAYAVSCSTYIFSNENHYQHSLLLACTLWLFEYTIIVWNYSSAHLLNNEI